MPNVCLFQQPAPGSVVTEYECASTSWAKLNASMRVFSDQKTGAMREPASRDDILGDPRSSELRASRGGKLPSTQLRPFSRTDLMRYDHPPIWAAQSSPGGLSLTRARRCSYLRFSAMVPSPQGSESECPSTEGASGYTVAALPAKNTAVGGLGRRHCIGQTFS